MKDYPYNYTICRENNPAVFRAFCKRLDEITGKFTKRPLLTDVDGSTVQTYEDADGRRIAVYDDYDIGAVYMLTDFDPMQVLEEKLG